MSEEIDFSELLEELSTEELEEVPQNNDKFETVTDDNVNEFVLTYGAKLVKDGMASIDKIKGKITSAQNADEISALSEMVRAMNSTLETLTKISIQNKKEKNAKEVRQLAHQQKLELPNGPKTQIIVGTREDIFKRILESDEELIKKTDTVEVIDD